MSGLGRTLADLELRNARTMHAAQAHYDNLTPPERDDSADELRDILTAHQELIGRAERAMARGQLDAARDLLIEAGRELAENAQEVTL